MDYFKSDPQEDHINSLLLKKGFYLSSSEELNTYSTQLPDDIIAGSPMFIKKYLSRDNCLCSDGEPNYYPDVEYVLLAYYRSFGSNVILQLDCVRVVDQSEYMAGYSETLAGLSIIIGDALCSFCNEGEGANGSSFDWDKLLNNYIDMIDNIDNE